MANDLKKSAILDDGLIFYVFFYFLKVLFIHETLTERGRDTCRGRSRLHAGSPTWGPIPGLQDHTPGESGAKPLSHRGCPRKPIFEVDIYHFVC